MVITHEPSAPVPLAGHSSSGMFDARLTRTGAMMGTPAYMAPEQFLGTPTDARSDQFSFCISLYEALYGERPFEGASMTTLTANVVQGNVRDAPAGSKVPLWVRRVLLRGLRPRARDRWASMEALIEALEKDPNIQRRKWAAAAAGAAVIGGLALGGWRLLGDQRQVCSGGPPKLAGIWDLRQTGRSGARAPRADSQSVHADRQELCARRLRNGQPRAHGLRPELGEHAQGGVRGDAGPPRAVGRGDGPKDGLPDGASRRTSSAHRRFQ